MTGDRGERLDGMETLMWRLHGDPQLRSTFGSVSLLDQPPDRRRLERDLTQALSAVPRLRQRVEPSTLPTIPPAWIDDPELDLARHLRWEQAGPDASLSSVLDSAAQLVATPFDLDHPLWEVRIVSGLPGGRAALVQRMHHVVTDGIGGIRIAEHLFTASPDDRGARPEPFAGGDATPPVETWGERAALAIADRVTDIARSTASAARWAVDGLADPGRFADAGTDAVEALASLRRQLLVLEPARSTLWTARSEERRLVAATIPFDAVRSAATERGVTVTAVLVTAILRGAAAYHRAYERPVEQLRLAVPVSTRTDRAAGGNAFAPLRLVLASGEGLAAPAHLQAVAERLGDTTHERATSLVGAISGLAGLVPTPVLTSMFQRQASTVDLVVSSLRAAPFPLYVAGARIEATHPCGPLMATPVNVTSMTCDGRVDLGIHVDSAAVEDPERLRDNVVGAFHEVTALV